jgi:uncharacterized membrane protein (UPF0127 family)
MKIKSGSKFFEINGFIKAGNFLKFRGLMFRRRENAPMIIFESKKPFSIHSFFVFFDFLAIWLDKNNQVIETKIVKPFSIHEKPRGEFLRLIEIPMNKRYYDIIKSIVD